MKFYNTTKLALILAAQSELEGMVADNLLREQSDLSPAYDGKAFSELANELRRLSEIKDDDSDEKESGDISPLGQFGLVGDFVAGKYSQAKTAEFCVQGVKQYRAFYLEYLDYCSENCLRSLSFILFGVGLVSFGFKRKRSAAGVFYTVFTK